MEYGIWILIILVLTSNLFYRPALSCRHEWISEWKHTSSTCWPTYQAIAIGGITVSGYIFLTPCNQANEGLRHQRSHKSYWLLGTDIHHGKICISPFYPAFCHVRIHSLSAQGMTWINSKTTWILPQPNPIIHEYDLNVARVLPACLA